MKSTLGSELVAYVRWDILVCICHLHLLASGGEVVFNWIDIGWEGGSYSSSVVRYTHTLSEV